MFQYRKITPLTDRNSTGGIQRSSSGEKKNKRN